MGRNESGAHVSEVGPHGLCGQNGITRCDRARQSQRPIEPLANFLDQGEWAFHARMAPCPRSHRNQPVRALFNGFMGMLVVDHIVQHHTAVAVRRGIDLFACAQGGDDDRHLVLHAQGHVMLQAVIALVHDLVDGKGCGRLIRIGLVVGGQRLCDFDQPLLQLRSRTGIECRHGAHNTSFALFNHQLRVADDEQRRGDDRKWQVG